MKQSELMVEVDRDEQGRATRLSISVPRSCLGRLACILVSHSGEPFRSNNKQGLRVYGNPIDFMAGEPMVPKRIRIQRGEPSLAGQVVAPHEYQFLWWAEDEED